MATVLSRRAVQGRLRSLTLPGPKMRDFSSNDFLSLSNSPLLKSKYLCNLQAEPSFHLGSGGSRLLDGNSVYAEQLEQDIAAFHGAPAALLFNSGFDANSGFFASVPQSGDIILYDEHIHASVHDGMKFSRAQNRVPFRHSSVHDFEAQLEKVIEKDSQVRTGQRNVFVALESVYSMGGDLAPIADLVLTVERLLPNGNGHVIVDEAHSTGVYGLQGRGLVSSLGLEGRIFARLHTFGKALAGNGAAILCPDLTRQYLINYARPLIYTTSMSFPSLVAVRTAYEFMMSGETEPLSSHLFVLINHLHEQLRTVVQPVIDVRREKEPVLIIPEKVPDSPIFSLVTPDPRSLATYCQEADFMVRAILAPTVPEGTSRVRVCLHAGNTFEDVNHLVERIRMWVVKYLREKL